MFSVRSAPFVPPPGEEDKYILTKVSKISLSKICNKIIVDKKLWLARSNIPS